jgi:hypothetical protein
MPPQSRFVYHAEVVAFGATIDKPRRREVRGAIALPSIGGRASRQEGPPELGKLVRYDYATSSVSGEKYVDERDLDEFETRGQCSMEGLEFEDVLRADVLSAVLTSRYAGRHRFVEELLTVKGLVVDGTPIIVRPRLDLVRKCPTLDDLRDRAKMDQLLTDDVVVPGTPRESGRFVETQRGLGCYLLEPHYLAFDRGHLRYEVFLGEYMIFERLRRLTMIRIEAHPRGDHRDDAGQAAMLRRPRPPRDDDDDDDDDDPKNSEGTTVFVNIGINGHTYP